MDTIPGNNRGVELTNGSGGPGTGGPGPGVTGSSKPQHPDPSNLGTWLTGIPGEGALAAIVGAVLGTILATTDLFAINAWGDVSLAFAYVLIVGFAGYSIHMIGIAILLTNWKVLAIGITGFVGTALLLLVIAAVRSDIALRLTLHSQMTVVPIILFAWLTLTVSIATLSRFIAKPRGQSSAAPPTS